MRQKHVIVPGDLGKERYLLRQTVELSVTKVVTFDLMLWSFRGGRSFLFYLFSYSSATRWFE